MRLGGLWRDADFRRLWAGQAVSQIGSRITREGLPLTAYYLLKASPLEMGILSGVGAAAILIFGLFAGAWADRVRRRPVLIAADLGRAAVLGWVPLAVWMHRLTIGQLYLVAAIGAILTVLFDVSYQAYLPSLVSRENLLEGNSKLALTESIAEVAGPGLTGVLVQAITAPMAILFDAVSFLCSAISVALIGKPEARPAQSGAPNMLREIAEGLQTSWRNPVLRALALRAGTLGLFGGVFSGLYVLYAVRDLGLSAALLGAVISVGGASNLLGALAAQWIGERWGAGPTLIGTAAVGGLAALLVPLARGPALLAAATLAAGQMFDLIWPIYYIHELSVRQAVTPSHLLARVNSAMHLMFRGLLPLGALAGGALAQGIGIRSTLYLGAAGSTLSTLWLVFSPVRGLRQIPVNEEPV